MCNLFWKNIKFIVFLQLWVTLLSTSLLRKLSTLSHFHRQIFHEAVFRKQNSSLLVMKEKIGLSLFPTILERISITG